MSNLKHGSMARTAGWLAALAGSTACAHDAGSDGGADTEATGTGGTGAASTGTTAMTEAAASSDASGDSSSTGGAVDLEWTECHGGYECTTVTVPIDGGDPGSDTIELRVLRAAATGERRGALLVNQGGPGESTVAWLAGFHPIASSLLFPSVAQHFDFIAVDWRGVGESEQIQCDITDADANFRSLPLHPGTGADQQAYDDLFAEYHDSCNDGHDGALFQRMSTEDAARDLERVREALGESQISFLGMSYGGYLGAVYASLFPDRVRAFVLDSPASPTPDLLTDVGSWATHIEPLYEAFFIACGADPTCTFHGGEGVEAVTTAYETLLSDLEAAGGIAVGNRTLTRSDVGKAIYPKITGGAFTQAASALRDLEQGDGAALLDAADAWYAGSGPDLFDTQVIFCLDRSAASTDSAPFWEQLAVLESGDAPHIAFDIAGYWGVCRDWPVQRDTVPISAPSAPPVLVLAGEADIWAPRAYAEATVGALANDSYLVIGDGPDHVQSTQVTPSMCASAAVEAFIEDPSIPPQITDCNLGGR